MEEVSASCITESEELDAVCLNQWVLQTPYFFSTDNSMRGILNLHMSMFEVAYAPSVQFHICIKL